MSLWQKAWQRVRHAGWWLLHEWFYDLGWFVNRIFAKTFSKPEFYGLENVPRKGAILFTANHLSQWDIFFMHYILPRAAYWMTKREHFEVPVFGGWARLYGAFPVERGAYNREALNFSVKLLEDGQLLVIFPEGHRARDYRMGPGHSGAALVALRANALIVPVAFTGTEKISRRKEYDANGKKIKPRVVVRVGQPYRLPRQDESGQRLDLDELSDLLMSKIAELLPPEYQGYYAPEKLAERKVEREKALAEKQARRPARKATLKQNTAGDTTEKTGEPTSHE